MCLDVSFDVLADAEHGHSCFLIGGMSTLAKRVSPNCMLAAMAMNLRAGNLLAMMFMQLIIK